MKGNKEEMKEKDNINHYYDVNNTELPRIEVIKREYVEGNILKETTLTTRGLTLKECLETIFILKDKFKDRR